MAPAISRSLLLGSAVVAVSATQSFVPACIAEQCFPEMQALVGDDYTRDAVNCTVTNFGPCASKAWECLGDAPCQAVLTCAPHVFNTCKADIWKMLTDPDEREKIMCMAQCFKDGQINPFCVATHCGKAAITCLADETCRDAAICLPQAVLGCSSPAFSCLFGKDEVCRANIQCLGNGVAQCGAPVVNILTDSKIADVITCAGSKCPHPATTGEATRTAQAVLAAGAEPSNVAEQLLCMADKCTAKVIHILADQDTKDLLTCALKEDLIDTCKAVWGCLGDSKCSEALSCWSKPFDSCSGDLWKAFTDQTQRQRIETGAQCLRSCYAQHKDDFTEAAFCVLDNCAQGLLDCSEDETCKNAVKCLPDTVGQCVMPQLDAYLNQELFTNSTKCLGRGLEMCGRGAIEMLRDQNIAEAVQCSSQCTRTAPLSKSSSTTLLV